MTTDTTIQALSSDEQITRTAAYLRRSLADLRSLATLMGLDATGSKAQLVARIIQNSRKAEVAPKHFDMRGLYLRTIPAAGRAPATALA